MRKTAYQGFAEMIRRRRKELELNLSDVAEKMGWSIPYVSELERGIKQPPPAESLKRLALALQLNAQLLAYEAELSRRSIELDLEGTGAAQRQLAVMLARRFDQGLTDNEAEELLEHVKKLGGVVDVGDE